MSERGGPLPRSPVLASAVVLGAACLAPGCDGAGEPPAPRAEPAAALRSDRRVAELLGSCPQTGFYDRDLSDIVPVLLEKLERGRPDPLKRAKEELGLLDARVFPALGNAFHAFYSDLMRSAYLENVVDALAFNASDESHELLLEALKHPQESVRAKALDGLARHARPGDFDILAGRLAIETRELRRQSVAALFQADPARAEALCLGFVAGGKERDLWLSAAQRLATTTSEECARRCAELFGAQEPILATQLAAGAARSGHPKALEHLQAELRQEDVQRRLTAVTALQRAGLAGELEHALLEDPASEVRAIAAVAVGQAEELGDQRRTWLRSALNDESPVVRAEALRGLCAHGDAEGLARALAQLDGEPTELQAALQALREPVRRDPALARSAFERLLQRHALEEHRPIQQRTATFKAIGQMPLREAAEFLHRTGIEAGEERIESLRAHDWLMIQAANTDLAGRGYLAEALAAEDDPLRRVDLIDAVGSFRDDLARTQLLELVEHGARWPLERLFAASTLIKVGPSWEVAPRLKRACYAMQDREELEARTALQCLLWQWY